MIGIKGQTSNTVSVYFLRCPGFQTGMALVLSPEAQVMELPSRTSMVLYESSQYNDDCASYQVVKQMSKKLPFRLLNIL